MPFDFKIRLAILQRYGVTQDVRTIAMPFKSEAQRRFMHAKHPQMAKEWEKHTPKGKKLPEKVEKESAFSIRLGRILDEILRR